MVSWLLYEHDDGRHAVAPTVGAATFAKDDPKWHRVGPVDAPDFHQQILNIKFDKRVAVPGWMDGYENGFRDAQHAAAELVNAAGAREGGNG